MSDERAFAILRSRRWTPRDLHTAAQRELSRDRRVENLRMRFAQELRDPMSRDIIGWDEHQAKGTNWPWCHVCKQIVRGFGVEDRETDRPLVVAKCHGRKDAIQVHRPRTGDAEADSRRLRDIYKHLVFFAR